jgi:subfamily B ATP-binding cassette protein MsbA
MSNVDLVQLSGAEAEELIQLEAVSDRVRHHGFAARARRYIVPRIVDVVNSTGIVILGCTAVFLFISVESSSIGRLSVFFISLRRLASHVEQLTGAWAQIVSGLPALEKVLWVFKDEDKAFIESGNKEFSGVDKKIEFQDVRFSYDNKEVLKGISFSIPANKTLAVVGSSGSGKTTMLSLLARFYECDAGAIKVDGVDIKEFVPSSYRSKIALVSQNSMIINGTIRRNICYGLDEQSITDDALEQATRKANIYDFILKLPEGFDTVIGGHGVRLSGGERQRLSIARAFLRNPQILILDEPTSALDAKTEELIQIAVNNISKDRTVFVVAHRLSTIRNADYLIVLENGQISEQGTIQELLDAKGRFFDYCELQRIFY